MKVFYLFVENAKKNLGKGFLKKYADIDIKSEKRFWEYTLGRYLVKTAANKFYNIQNTNIVIKDSGKPEFEEGGIYFSISHSKEIVAVCFDEAPCGIDIEFIKDRNLSVLSEYYNKNFENHEDFYRFWTKNEAEYKLGQKAKYNCFFKIGKYFFAVVSDKEINNIEIMEFNTKV